MVKGLIMVLGLVAIVACHGDGNRAIDPCMLDDDHDEGCGNDRPGGSLDCGDHPPCNVDEVLPPEDPCDVWCSDPDR